MSYPIVLTHGVRRCDKFWREALKLDNNNAPKLYRPHYFKGLLSELKSHGFTDYHSDVNWAAGVEIRASKLRVRWLLRRATGMK